MLKTFSNLSRKSDKYGNVHFISFYSSVLSRLAYFSDEYFLEKYVSIFGPIINENIMKCIDSAEDISALLDDETIFKLNSDNPYNFPTYTYNNKQFVEFIDLAKQVNVINNEVNDKNLLYNLQKINNLKTDLPDTYKKINEFTDSTKPNLSNDDIAMQLDDVKTIINSESKLEQKEKDDLIAKLTNIINKEGFKAFRKSYILSILDKEYRLQMVKYISIANSNYGEIYVVADKRMPKTMFLVFRGTYSGKSAAAYTKPTSLIPLNIGVTDNAKSESYLFGIFKITIEVIHTIIESMRYLATNFLNAKDENSIKLITTGHSLGGAMSTNFAFLWMNITSAPPYNAYPYNAISKNIGCFTLGAPRSVNADISEIFCQYVKDKRITFLRITTRGDPVPAMPFKASYYSHPCSDKTSVKNGYRELVTEDCNGLLTMRPFPNVKYNGNLDCQNYKTRAYIPNPLSHTIYLDILYLNAVDIKNFGKSIISIITKEIVRGPQKSTKCRIILYDNEYRAVFFDMNNARGENVNDYENEKALMNEPSQSPPQNGELSQIPLQNAGFGLHSFKSNSQSNSGFGIGKSKSVVEDINVNMESFDNLIKNAKPIVVSPLPMDGETYNPFNSRNPSPKLCCIGIKQKGQSGGIRKTKNKRFSKKSRKSITRKHKKQTKTRKNKRKS